MMLFLAPAFPVGAWNDRDVRYSHANKYKLLIVRILNTDDDNNYALITISLNKPQQIWIMELEKYLTQTLLAVNFVRYV